MSVNPRFGIPGHFAKGGDKSDFDRDDHDKYDKVRSCKVCRNPMGKAKAGRAFRGRPRAKHYYASKQPQESALRGKNKDYDLFGLDAFDETENVCHACKKSSILQMSNFETTGKAWDWDLAGIGDGDKEEGEDFLQRMFGPGWNTI